ncbi:MAG: PBP1A family penicillin-binding protein [Synergistaceae bacterium]|nr:PBP1A family penicillin-binding protein [Synergistaceae bacterium]
MANNTNNYSKKSGNKKYKKKESSTLKIIFLSFITFVLLAIAGVVVAGTIFVVQIADELPTNSQLKTHRINVPSVIYDRNNEVIAKLFTENRNPVELKNISPWMVKAVLAAEDSDFYSHSGISIWGIARALWFDIQHKLLGTGSMQGGSTITQQLSRSLYLSQEVTLTRKIKEMLISFRLEDIYSKDKILEMYLNTIYFGRGAWGIDTAAYTYFGKSASELSVAESTILAGLIPAPNRYNPEANLSRAKSRQSYVLERMKTLGWLDESQVERAKKEELVFKHTPNKVEEYNRAPYFVSHILFNDLLPKYGTDKVYGGGMEVFTTLDIRLQDKAQAVVADMKTQGAIVAIEPGTGEVLTLVGGKDFNESKFNRATQAYRQPGSSFKPFIYGAAIEKGIRPSDHFIDDKLIFNVGKTKTWTPGNYDGKFHGEVTMLYALTKSLNTVPVRCSAHIGISPVIEFARQSGITTQYLQPNLSVALGSASLTPLEMAFAFSVFANEGKRPEKPVFIREIRSWTGETLEKNEPASIQAIRAETSWTILSMLFDVITAGTGTRAAIPKTQVFGKTGTTNDFIDAWFIGGVPGLVASIFAGNDDNKPLGKGMTGGVVAAPPWKDFMEYAHSTLGLKPNFGVPSPSVDVKRVSICRTTGFLSTSECPAVSLYLEEGTAPTSTCPTHGGNGGITDDNAPVLIRIDQDADIFSEYEQQIEQLTEYEQQSDEYWYKNTYELPQQPKPPVNQNTGNETGRTPPAVNRVPIDSPETIEEKYQQLLKDYGIYD